MRSGQWRRGLFRLWIFLAVAWVVCVVSFVAVTGEASQKWKEYGLAQAYEKIILRIENGIEAGGLTNNEGKFVDVAQLTTDLDGVKSRQPGVNTKSVQASNWLFGLLAFLLVPTLGLLILGRAGIWVADGFQYGNQNYPK